MCTSDQPDAAFLFAARGAAQTDDGKRNIVTHARPRLTIRLAGQSLALAAGIAARAPGVRGGEGDRRFGQRYGAQAGVDPGP